MTLDERFLLTQTMKRTQTPDNIRAVDSDHPPAREAITQDIECFLVVFVPESRYHHYLIGDIEIGVGSR